jgi:hypothetical protein
MLTRVGMLTLKLQTREPVIPSEVEHHPERTPIASEVSSRPKRSVASEVEGPAVRSHRPMPEQGSCVEHKRSCLRRHQAPTLSHRTRKDGPPSIGGWATRPNVRGS